MMKSEIPFCDTFCCICIERPCKIQLNYSGYHKACEFCIQIITTDTPSITCKFCQANFPLVSSIYNICRNCKNPACKNFECYHGSDLINNTQYAECLVCTNCNKNFCCFDSILCSDCISLPTCQQCNTRGRLYFFEGCRHEVCYNCLHSHNCFQCTEIIKCPNCSEYVNALYTANCTHTKCQNCYYLNCISCEAKLCTDILCKNCYSLIDEFMYFSCGHLGCRSCKEYCRLCADEFICKNCEMKGQSSAIMICGHSGCELCYKENCKKCEVYLLDQISSSPCCIKCRKMDEIRQINCGHFICKNCEMYECCEDFKINTDILICSNCGNEECIEKMKFECSHEGCNNCKIAGCQKCIVLCECPNCTKVSTPIQLNCKHIGCIACFQSKNCIKCRFCIECNKTIAEDFFEFSCNHKICLNCLKKFDNCPLCKKKCEACGKITTEFSTGDCEHFICLGCLENNKDCLVCLRTTCINCKSSKSIDPTYMECPHKMCSHCIKEGFKCKSCFKECCSCKLIKKCFISECEHPMCSSCINGSKPCGRKVKIIIRNTCDSCNKSTKETLGVQLCKHKLCIQCIINNICKKCNDEETYKICCTCKNKATIQLKCKHFQCHICNNLNYFCLLCRFRCKFCANEVECLENLLCGHEACMYCKSINNSCLECSVKHPLKQKNPKKCIQCKKITECYTNLLCNHIICDKCSKQGYINLNFICLFCAKAGSKTKCLNCYQLCSFRFEDTTFMNNCCKKIFCVYCFRPICGPHTCKIP